MCSCYIDEKNCNPAHLGRREKIPLHVAVEHAQLDVVKYLVLSSR